MTCESLLFLVRQGVVLSGDNFGSPGKEIYNYLTFLSENETCILAEVFSSQFPAVPPPNSVAYALCIRYIYGILSKQGILLSNNSLDSIKQMDWTKSQDFGL